MSTVARGGSRRRAAAPAGRTHLLSYCDFVDAALFDPRWGYYSTGGVRFGEGGHYDTYPLALSPFFGRMIARQAFRTWRRLGSPSTFEIAELGAGNGQLCLDTLLTLDTGGGRSAAWKRFATLARYRIVERSPALAERQRRQLGPLAARVTWSDVDLAQQPPRAPFGVHGLLIANEVLDCLPHHKLVSGADGRPAVVHVAVRHRGAPVPGERLADLLADPRARRGLRFREVTVPLAELPALETFVRHWYPELLPPRRLRHPVFVAPRLPRLIEHTARCYAQADALWIDYGAARPFHLRAPEHRKVFAGPPRSRRGVFDDPGHDDITFMVDFTLAADAARAAGWAVTRYGPQALLAGMSGVALDAAAREAMLTQRALTWLLAVAGVGAERSWRRGAIGWATANGARTEPVRRYVERSVREFLRERNATFKLLALRRRSR